MPQSTTEKAPSFTEEYSVLLDKFCSFLLPFLDLQFIVLSLRETLTALLPPYGDKCSRCVTAKKSDFAKEKILLYHRVSLSSHTYPRSAGEAHRVKITSDFAKEKMTLLKSGV
jgi:hypothetical protein